MLSGRRIAVAAAASLIGLLAGTSTASAAQVIGQAGPPSGVCGQYGGSTFIQTGSELSRYAAPFDGVITSWRNGGQWVNPTLKVARLGPASTYTVVASDGPRSATNQDLPVRFSVRQGDVIGVHIPSAVHSCAYPSSAGDVVGVDSEANLAPGGTGSFDYSTTFQVNVAATIERDRDGDGYGDETQDGCPTNGFTHGPCPLPTVLGETFTPINSSCEGTFVPQLPAEVRYSAPRDGVITSWSHQANAIVSGTIKFKVLRPLGGANYLAVGDSAPQTPSANQLNTFSTRIPVRQGDWIGLRADGVACSSAVSTGGSSLFQPSDVSPGASAAFTPSNRRIDLAATLEADADNDGFGDTTQDRCPTNASTQGACPVKPPPPPVDKACEQARKKLGKAKTKLAKLKKNDAPAKRVKKAKKSVKKAKAGVREAC